MPHAIPLETREGDVLIRVHAAYLHVWLVVTPGAIEHDSVVEPFITDRHAEALEWARKLAASTRGRIFSIDQAGVWTKQSSATSRRSNRNPRKGNGAT